MLKRWQFGVSMALSVVAIGLMIGNAALLNTTRRLQAEVNARQQFVQQGANLEGLYRGMAKDLAELALRGNDGDLLQALAANGISVSPNTAPTAGAASPNGVKR